MKRQLILWVSSLIYKARNVHEVAPREIRGVSIQAKDKIAPNLICDQYKPYFIF